MTRSGHKRKGFHGRRTSLEVLELLAFLPVIMAFCSAGTLAASSEASSPRQTVMICGSAIDVRFTGTAEGKSLEDLLNWIHRAASAVCVYYGKFPISHLNLDVHVRGEPGVHHGVTYPDDDGIITISVGSQTTPAQLNDDWMLTHEMIHLAFPSMTDNHHWIEEGISVYVEPIARVQAGQLKAEEMWKETVRDMPQGEPDRGDQGLDHTHTWGRTYWGGAMFCLVADVRIRQQTHNHKGLQDALRGILNAGGNINQDWPIDRAFAVGDKATGTTVLGDLDREMRDKPSPVDLVALWKELGVQPKSDGSIEFVNAAQLATVREAITAASTVR